MLRLPPRRRIVLLLTTLATFDRHRDRGRPPWRPADTGAYRGMNAAADPGRPRAGANWSAAMTLAEKVSMLARHQHVRELVLSRWAYLPAIPRLNVPAVTMTDGPAGVAGRLGQEHRLPSPSAEAASFDTHVAQLYGTVLGLG